jgi:hypothetical protein
LKKRFYAYGSRETPLMRNWRLYWRSYLKSREKALFSEGHFFYSNKDSIVYVMLPVILDVVLMLESRSPIVAGVW